MADPLLIADIGGTNARFALLDEAGGGGIGPVHRVKLDDFAGAAGMVAAFLEAHAPGRRTPRGAVLAVAGPVGNNRARLTNRGWMVDGAEIAGALGIGAVRVVNDFAAVSWSLPVLTGADLFPLGGGGAGEPGGPMAVLGPGTGLGVGAFLPPDRALVTEGGHASLAAHDPREAAVIGWLRARHGHVSAERVLSGMGLANLHAALAAIDGVQSPRRDPAEVTEAGLSGGCALCREALRMFCAILGSVAGDLALLYGARGGVFVAGGIPPRFPRFIAESDFRARFEAKGRFNEWLRPVPTHVVMRPDAPMLGLAALARRL